MKAYYENFPNLKFPELYSLVLVSKEFMEYDGKYAEFFHKLKDALDNQQIPMREYNSKIDFVMMYMMKDI